MSLKTVKILFAVISVSFLFYKNAICQEYDMKSQQPPPEKKVEKQDESPKEDNEYLKQRTSNNPREQLKLPKVKSKGISQNPLKKLSGIWKGIMSASEDSIIMYLTVNGDSVLGNSVITLSGIKRAYIVKGIKDTPEIGEDDGYNYINLYEQPQIAKKGAFNLYYSFEMPDMISGTWRRDDKDFQCSLKRISDLTLSNSDPVDVIKNFFRLIDYFAVNHNTKSLFQQSEDSLKAAYNFWFNPETSLSDFYKWRSAFTNTLKDSIAKITVNDNTDGLNSTITLVHQTKEYLPFGDSIAIQSARYENKYQLIFADNNWKLISGDAKEISRKNVEYLPRENSPDADFSKSEKGIPAWVFILGAATLLIIGIMLIRNYRLDREKKKLALTTEQLTLDKAQLYEASSKLSAEKEILTAEKEKLLSDLSTKNTAGSPVEMKIEVSQPSVPQELIDACKRRECVLYTGSEISAIAGYPNWHDLIKGLLDWSIENKYITDESYIDSLHTSLNSNRVDQTADSIALTLGKMENVKVNDYLSKLFIKPNNDLPGVYKIIKSTNYSAILTSTYDEAFESIFEKDVEVFTPSDVPKIQEAASLHRFFILKIYGDVRRLDTVMFPPSKFQDEMLKNLEFSQFIETLFYTNSVLFIGEEMDDIESFFQSVKFRGFRSRPHFALVGVKTAGWKTTASIFEERYGVKVIPYEYGNTEQMNKFLSELSISAPNLQAGESEKLPTVISKIIIENIGPFDKLELELDQKWNIFLGDNGVGKSTILKAIAMSICGKEAEEYAFRIIKSGETSASIILEVAELSGAEEKKDTRKKHKAYITKIFKTGRDKAEIEKYVRPLDAEGWLAVAFPPLRTVSWKRPDGPQPDGSKIPITEDLLPIIKGEPDPRMNKLKQWVVNQYFKSIDTNRSEDDRKIFSEQLKKFVKIIDELTPNLLVSDIEVNTDNFEVYITTEDGKIPVEAISQGTLSLMSWVGILLQRLYEVFGQDEDPTARHAIVIMDEIDAHMHPEWQQSLVHHLKKIFKNIQFIVSTHSPLVVGGMPPEQLFRFTRNENGHIIKIDVEEYDTFGRADQLLTSPLFGLNTTLDKETQENVIRYEELLGKSKRTEEEEEEFSKLEKNIENRIPSVSENPKERKAQKILEEIYESQLKNTKDESLKKLKEKAEKIIKGVS